MKAYGSYHTLKSISLEESKAVFTARDKTTEGFVVKTFPLAYHIGLPPAPAKDSKETREAKEKDAKDGKESKGKEKETKAKAPPETKEAKEAREAREAKVDAFNNFFYGSVETQKKTALNSPYIAPILQYGQDGEAAWYVTNLYPTSVQKLIFSRTNLSRENFYNIIYSIVRGALDLKKTTGRPHGNLKPSNILMTGDGKLKVGQVVLTDPAPGDAAQAEKFELADLRDIGEVMYRLVYPHETREIDLQKIPLLPTSQRWVGLFGSDAEEWFQIFNKLLERGLSLKNYNLDQLEADLRKLKPTSKRVQSLVGLLAALFVITLIVFFWIKSGPRPAAPVAVTTPQTSPQEQERKVQEAKRHAEERRLAEQKAVAEAKAREQARAQTETEAAKARELARTQTDAEAKAREEVRKAEEARKAAEEKRLASVEAKARAETEKALLEAARKVAEAERLRQEAEQKRITQEQKAQQLTAELERREKASQEAARKAAEEARLRQQADARRLEEERKARELAAELERQEKENQEVARRAAEQEQLRKEAEAKRQTEETRARELAAELARKERERELRTVAATRETERNVTALPIRTTEPTTATSTSEKPRKGQKWVNSIGMKFVPIGDHQILFAAWETRRRDYEEFAKSSRFVVDQGWKNITFKQSGGQPVVNVNASDAEAFCKWLTESERNKGFLDDTQFYRVPTDTEWSQALGGTETGSTYLWGTSWPPPPGVGNYSSIYSYDRFDFTAPVGQFPASARGVYDLAGNVWEICQDGSRQTVGRGGSWLTASPDQLTAAYRLPLNASDRREDVGFRCVLVMNGD